MLPLWSLALVHPTIRECALLDVAGLFFLLSPFLLVAPMMENPPQQIPQVRGGLFRREVQEVRGVLGKIPIANLVVKLALSLVGSLSTKPPTLVPPFVLR